jgi:hypothetical protein
MSQIVIQQFVTIGRDHTLVQHPNYTRFPGDLQNMLPVRLPRLPHTRFWSSIAE